jgi:NEDD8-activating enzyme E1 regulatory subunit
LLGCTSAGTETLKNLILPGIGRYTIVDDHRVTMRDCGNDFFVTEKDIGQPKSKVVCGLLGELNPDS